MEKIFLYLNTPLVNWYWKITQFFTPVILIWLSTIASLLFVFSVQRHYQQKAGPNKPNPIYKNIAKKSIYYILIANILFFCTSNFVWVFIHFVLGLIFVGIRQLFEKIWIAKEFRNYETVCVEAVIVEESIDTNSWKGKEKSYTKANLQCCYIYKENRYGDKVEVPISIYLTTAIMDKVRLRIAVRYPNLFKFVEVVDAKTVINPEKLEISRTFQITVSA